MGLSPRDTSTVVRPLVVRYGHIRNGGAVHDQPFNQLWCSVFHRFAGK